LPPLPALVQKRRRRASLYVALRRLAGRRLPSDAAQRRHLLLSANGVQPGGKAALLYEANPIAFVCEQAGGVASDGSRRIMDIQPDSVHQRTPLAVGSPYEMGMYLDYAKKDKGR